MMTPSTTTALLIDGLDQAAALVTSLSAAWLLAIAAVAAVLYVLLDARRYAAIPSIEVPSKPDEAAEVLTGAETYTPGAAPLPKGSIPCYDPSTMQLLGYAKAMTPAEVHQAVARAKEASKVWRHSSFAQRRLLLQVLLKFIIGHQTEICRVSSRDSGKTPLEAVLGEIVVTAEKLSWLIANGERVLAPCKRGAGTMAFYKSARVEWVPVGVVGAIVPWNWPFHNIINPISAAVMAGNAIVIKVSEHASWCIGYYSRVVEAALAAAGAPAGLVSFVTGYGDAGHALVTGGVDKVVFVGSTDVGKKVMAAASEALTPVTLELGGKDAFIVCDDADLSQVVPIAIKAAFLNCGQNCASGERFIVQRSIAPEFVRQVSAVARAMKQGPTLGAGPMDAGAMCMPGAVDKVQALIDDAVSKGAVVTAGGAIGPANPPHSSSSSHAPAAANGSGGGGAAPPLTPTRVTRRAAAAAAASGSGDGGSSANGSSSSGRGQFYPPTVITGVRPGMALYSEEVFGPVMSVFEFETDAQAVALANDCPFGLGSSVFSGSPRRARAIGAQLEAGMTSLNDFNATYMCQGLPFGGVKQSGFGRFAGVEGLRALCVPKAVAEDALPWLLKTTIPPLWQHPVGPAAYPFAEALTAMFYGPSLGVKAAGLAGVLRAVLAGGGGKGKATADAKKA